MDLQLQNNVAIVTGASRGIGKAIALRLVEEGCSVAICARGRPDLEAAAAELEERGGRVLALQLDLTEPDAPKSLVTETVGKLGRLDILVNNVGGNRRAAFVDTSDEDWSAIVELNTMSHIRCSRAAIPYMQEQGRGAILFISSIFGREAGGPGLSIYNTTKSALISVSKIMALELASSGIRVNTVAPGSIRFPGGSWDRRMQEDPEGMQEFIRENLPLGRFGMVDEIADVVAFLASPRASLVTGACLNVDGGQSRSLI